jgi:hypothetical protein
MLAEACHWTAMKAYTSAVADLIRTSCNSTLTESCSAWSAQNLHLDPESMCEFALALDIKDKNVTENPMNKPLLEARVYCVTFENGKIDANYQQARILEHQGSPFSFGDSAGAGVRIVLGTDFTVGTNETYSNWLVPASPGAFDEACATVLFPDPDGRSDCTLFGRHGDGGESWSGLGSPLGYDASLWEPAGIETWATLRYGMNLSSSYNGGNVGSGPAGNLLLALESTMESAYQVPMSGLSNRTWWISGYKIPELYLGDFDLRDPKGPYSGVAPVQGKDDGEELGRYWISDEVKIKDTLAFASVNASDRSAGPAGVVFAGRDLRGAFSADCERLEQSHNLRFGCSNSKVRSSSFHAPFLEGGPFAPSCITVFSCFFFIFPSTFASPFGSPLSTFFLNDKELRHSRIRTGLRRVLPSQAVRVAMARVSPLESTQPDDHHPVPGVPVRRNKSTRHEQTRLRALRPVDARPGRI